MWKSLPILFILLGCSTYQDAGNKNDFLKVEKQYAQDAADLGSYRRATRDSANDLLHADDTAYRAIQTATSQDYSAETVLAAKQAVQAYEIALIQKGVKGYASRAVSNP